VSSWPAFAVFPTFYLAPVTLYSRYFDLRKLVQNGGTGWNMQGMMKLFLLLLVATFHLSRSLAMAGEVPVLGLNQMIQMALEKSPEMKEAEQDITAAQSELAQAKAGQWAQLDMVAVTGPAQNADRPTVLVTQSDNGQYQGQLQGHDYDKVNIFGSLDFSIIQPLYTFGKISNRQDAAASGVGAQKAAREKKRAEVVLQIKEL
jgi:outer membrane protein